MITPIKVKNGHFLFLSSAPGNPLYSTKHIIEDVTSFKNKGVKVVFCFLTDQDLINNYGDKRYLFETYNRSHIQVFRFPIRDFSVPHNFEGIKDVIIKIKSALGRGNVLLHCGAGLGRTGLVFCCLLVSQGYKPRDAILKARAQRPGMVETVEQINFIYDFYEEMRKR